MNNLANCFFPRLLGLLIVSTIHSSASAQLTATPGDGFQGIWYEISGGGGDYPNKYGGGLATYPQQIAPMGVYSPIDDRTYFAFNMDINPGPGNNIGHAISYFDHQSGLVARPQVWLDKQTGDAHDAPVLALDGDGYLYLFSNSHGDSRESFIHRSASPGVIDTFVSLLDSSSSADMDVFGNPPGNPGQTGVPHFSYGSAWYVPNTTEEEKFLFLHTRYNGGRQLYSTSSVDGDTWTERKGLAQIESGQYQKSWIKPDGASVGTIFNVHPTGQGLDWRTDLYYLETSDQAQTWQTADGLTLVDNSGSNNNPLTSRPDGSTDGAALVYDAAPNERVYLKSLNYDSSGNPIIMFLSSPSHMPGDHGDPGPDRFLKTAYWTGGQWDIKDFGTTNHNYDTGAMYVEPDGTWRVIAPFIDGPQQYGTGGEIGVWTSTDQGTNWALAQQLTQGSYYNHTYVQQPLNAQDDFYAFWADGDAWEPSDTHLYFTTKSGEVYHLPYDFPDGADFAQPEPYTTRLPDTPTTIRGTLVSASTSGEFANLTLSHAGVDRTFAPEDLIGGRLTAFGGKDDGQGGRVADIITEPGSSSAPPPSQRDGLLSDGKIDTVFVNLVSWSVDFDQPIYNQDGPDIVLLDWGSADTVDVTIRGTTIDDMTPATEDVFGESTSNRSRYESDQNDVDTLQALIAATFHFHRTTSGRHTAYLIDLSDFGLAHGAMFAVGEEIMFTDGQGIDPSEVYGVPSLGLPGDFNQDGSVNIADYTVWRNHLGAGYTVEDYQVWKANFGAQLTSSASHSEAAAVPEPMAAWIALTGCLMVSGWVRRRPSQPPSV